PLKWVGRKLDFMTVNRALAFFVLTYALGMLFLYEEDLIPAGVHEQLPVIIALIGLIMVLKSFTERVYARMAWIMIMMNHFYIALAISFNEHYAFSETLLYLSGI